MSQTYPSFLYQKIASVQENHFWFTSRSRMIRSCITSNISGYGDMKFLEIGCGTGIVMHALEDMGFLCTGLDVNAQAIALAREKTKGRLVRQSIFRYASKEKYDVVGAFDVMEHIGDDSNFLKICSRLLVSHGYLLLTVPAGMWLWSDVDAHSGHVRRYEQAEIVGKLQKAGFRIRSIRYWNTLLLPVYALWHRQIAAQNKDVVAAHLRPMPTAVNRFLEWIFDVELFIARFIRLPCGATLVICAQKGEDA